MQLEIKDELKISLATIRTICQHFDIGIHSLILKPLHDGHMTIESVVLGKIGYCDDDDTGCVCCGEFQCDSGECGGSQPPECFCPECQQAALPTDVFYIPPYEKESSFSSDFVKAMEHFLRTHKRLTWTKDNDEQISSHRTLRLVRYRDDMFVEVVVENGVSRLWLKEFDRVESHD